MTTQARTQPNKKNPAASGVVLASSTPRYQRWMNRLHEAIRSDRALSSWKEILGSGCRARDLEWLLYHAVDSIDTSRDMIRQAQAFRKARERLIELSRRLREDFGKMEELQFAGQRALHVALAMWTLKEIPPMFYIFSDLLAHFEKLMSRLDLMTDGRSAKRQQASLAVGAESLLFIYVNEFTGREFREETAGLLKIAADVYGLEGREFNLEAVTKRLTRYRSRNALYYHKQQRWIEDFRRLHRKNSNISLDRFWLRRTLSLEFPKVVQRLLRKCGQAVIPSPGITKVVRTRSIL